MLGFTIQMLTFSFIFKEKRVYFLHILGIQVWPCLNCGAIKNQNNNNLCYDRTVILN